jgi:hypothetical protein
LNERSGKMRNKMLSRMFLPIVAAVILAVVIAMPALASSATASRMLPTSVESGNIFDVTVETSDCGAFGQVVETLPDGFTYVSCTPDDIGVAQVSNTVKFTFLGSASFTYRVEAPTVDTTTTYTFHGVVKDEDKNAYPIQDNDITVTVNVPPLETYTLTMAVSGGTHSTTPSVGSHTYDAGSVVDISATADSGWRFDHWSGNVADPSSSSTTVTMDSNKRVTAYFAPIDTADIDFPIYTLTVTCEPSEGGSVAISPSMEGNQYEEGTSIELTATPSEDYAFDSWSGDLSGSDNPTNITMDSDKSVVANFVWLKTEGSASFTVSPLNISPEQVQPNQTVNIFVSITNNGGEIESYEAALYINDNLEDTRDVTISPGLSQNVDFSITKAVPGIYTISLGGQQGQFTVVDSQSIGGGLDTGTTIAIVIIAVLIAALVFVFRRFKRGA